MTWPIYYNPSLCNNGNADSNKKPQEVKKLAHAHVQTIKIVGKINPPADKANIAYILNAISNVDIFQQKTKLIHNRRIKVKTI